MKKVYVVYFSPNKTTRTVATTIAKGTEINDIEEIDITLTKNRIGTSYDFEDESLIIFGMPVYGGRIPKLAADFLKTLNGNNQPAIAVVVYGNRDFDDALLELSDIIKERGFKTIAAGAFIGEHSFADGNCDIAKDRPNDKDKRKAQRLGNIVSMKLEDNDFSKPKIPGKRPYKSYGKPFKLAPVKGKNCTSCLACKEICPVDAIDDKGISDKEKCISCCACVKVCPQNSRKVKSPIYKPILMVLKKCKRKEVQTFI